MACDGWTYSLQRMDLLIISISSAGVYVVLEALKYSLEHPLKTPFMLKLSGVFFILSIIINFISQWTGQNANYHHIIWIDEQLLADIEPSAEQLLNINKYDNKASKWHAYTKTFNSISMILLFIGLILIMTYFFCII